MQLPILLVALVSLATAQHPGTMLHKHNLPGEKSLCNDGTRAAYYTQEGMASGSVLIGLQVGSVDNWSCSNYEPVLHTALRWANTSHFSQKTAS